MGREVANWIKGDGGEQRCTFSHDCDTLTKEQFKQHPYIGIYSGCIVKITTQKSWPQKRNNWSVNFISTFYHWSYILTKNVTHSISTIHTMMMNLF